MFGKKSRNSKLLATDGFPIMEVQPWYNEKLRVIHGYLSAYHQRFDLRNRPKMLLYIGAGPGLVKIKGQLDPTPATPLQILSGAANFQRYIFVEKHAEYAQALKVRLGREHQNKHCIVVEGDINKTIDKLGPYLPEKIGKESTAILCIVDLQSFDMDFETMQMIAEMDADIILVNSYIHTKYYSYKFYLEEEREQLNAYFGAPWARLAEGSTLQSDTSFFMLVVKAYLGNLKRLGYNITSTLHKYNSDNAPVPYYQIAYCTKSKTLKSVKQQMVKEAAKQTSLF